MHLVEEDDENETIIEDDGFIKLVAKWKKEFNNIKGIDTSE